MQISPSLVPRCNRRASVQGCTMQMRGEKRMKKTSDGMIDSTRWLDDTRAEPESLRCKVSLQLAIAVDVSHRRDPRSNATQTVCQLFRAPSIHDLRHDYDITVNDTQNRNVVVYETLCFTLGKRIFQWRAGGNCGDRLHDARCCAMLQFNLIG